MMVQDQYYERFYKEHRISVYKPWYKPVWYMYVDRKFLHNITFDNKKSAFQYLVNYINNG